MIEDTVETIDFESSPSEEAGALIGRYKLLEKLGEGGFGSVWAAEQKEPVRRRVALKIIKLGMDTKQVVARFEAERQALALMDHPNIAKVFDAGASDTGRPYFVMELVRGVRIMDYCDQERLDITGRLDLFIRVCHAIQHAHQKGIIHRDIKPSNVMVTLYDGGPVPKIIDFGIAKATQGDLTDKTVYTRYSQFIGTPAYMSPEQAGMCGLDIDTRTDVYSLGVLLYELLTGTTPFDAQELMKSGVDEMRRIIREQEPERPSTRVNRSLAGGIRAGDPGDDAHGVLRRLRGDLDWIVIRCLEKDRSRRYETASALAADVRRHLDNEPVLARPPSPGYILLKGWRRHRVAFSSAVAVFLAAAVSSVVSIWFFLQERDARQDEAEAKVAAEENEQIATANARRAKLNAYAADMNLADAAIKDGNNGKAMRILTRNVPEVGQSDLRNWEWRYLWQLTSGDQLMSLPAFDSHVFNVDYSPDGRLLTVALYDGRIAVWDLLRSRVDQKLGSVTGSPAVSGFSPDGNVLYGYSEPDQGIQRWAVPSYESLPSLQLNSTEKLDGVRNMSVSPDGKWLVAYTEWTQEKTNAYQAAAVLWNVDTLELVWRVPAPLFIVPMGVCSGVVAFGASSESVFIADVEDRVRKVDRATGETLLEWTAHERGFITAMAVSSTGRVATTGTDEQGTIKLWESAGGNLLRTLTGHSHLVFWLEYNQTKDLLVSGSADQTIRVWEVATGKERSVLQGHSDEVYALSLDSGGDRIASGSRDGVVSVWDIDPPVRTPHHLVQGISGLEHIFFVSPNGEHLFAYDEARRIMEFDSETLEERGLVSEFGSGCVLAISDDSQRVAVSRDGMPVEIRDLKSRELIKTLEQGVGGFFESGRIFIQDQKKKVINLYDTESGEKEGSWPLPDGLWSVLDISPNHRLMGYGHTGGGAVRRLSSNSELTPVVELAGHWREVSRLAFSPDHSKFASVSDSGRGFIWSTDDWAQVASLQGHLKAIHGVSFSPDSRRVITSAASPDSLILWDTEGHHEVLTINAGGSDCWNPVLVNDSRKLYALVYQEGQYHLNLWRAPTWEEIEATERGEQGAGR